MKTMREKFEELPEIKDILHTVVFNDQFNNYHDAMINSSPSVYFIRGAWHAFQEQQKKLDEVLNLMKYNLGSDDFNDMRCPDYDTMLYSLREIKDLLK